MTRGVCRSGISAGMRLYAGPQAAVIPFIGVRKSGLRTAEKPGRRNHLRVECRIAARFYELAPANSSRLPIHRKLRSIGPRAPWNGRPRKRPSRWRDLSRPLAMAQPSSPTAMPSGGITSSNPLRSSGESSTNRSPNAARLLRSRVLQPRHRKTAKVKAHSACFSRYRHRRMAG